jgi:hypothetical protein
MGPDFVGDEDAVVIGASARNPRRTDYADFGHDDSICTSNRIVLLVGDAYLRLVRTCDHCGEQECSVEHEERDGVGCDQGCITSFIVMPRPSMRARFAESIACSSISACACRNTITA